MFGFKYVRGESEKASSGDRFVSTAVFPRKFLRCLLALWSHLAVVILMVNMEALQLLEVLGKG